MALSAIIDTKRIRSQVRRYPFTLPALAIVLLTLFTALFPDVVAQGVPGAQNLRARLKPPGFVDTTGVMHPFGTDTLGRDVLDMVVAGARPALQVGFGAVAIALLMGVSAGLISGYGKGLLSTLIMRLVELQLAFPFFMIAVAVTGMLGPSLWLVLFIIALGTWVPYARVIRSEVLEVRSREYIQAAQALGAGQARILLRHVLPSSIPSIIVLASFNLATAILLEASLSFVGLGVPGTAPTWGRMLAEGRNYVATAWWLTVCPGASLFLLVFSVNLLSDFLKGVIDRKN
ncbi:MAG: ABC transporter permease [Acidimicrobiia bacterium]